MFAFQMNAIVRVLWIFGLSVIVCGSVLADETGIVPGDLVIGNVVNEFAPGHSGIYIGKWENLPKGLKTKYGHLLDEIDIRSGIAALKESYLTVDSMPGRGVRLSPLVEQFTDFVRHGRYPQVKMDFKGCSRWEGNIGGAIAWPGLPDNDARRWKIVEEALKAAAAHVPYESGTRLLGEELHWQWDTTMFAHADYKNMQLDCIGLLHAVYWKGAQIDLDISWAPWHSPLQTLEHAKSKQLFRKVNWQPICKETFFLGDWEVENTKGFDRVKPSSDGFTLTMLDASGSTMHIANAKQQWESPETMKLTLTPEALQVLKGFGVVEMTSFTLEFDRDSGKVTGKVRCRLINPTTKQIENHAFDMKAQRRQKQHDLR